MTDQPLGNALAWTYLIIGGVFEIGMAVGLKYTKGFTRLWPIVGAITSMTVSLLLLAKALQVIPVGTGYAVWTGVGAAGTALVGMFFLGEPRTAARLFFIFLIVVGIVGLRLFS